MARLPRSGHLLTGVAAALLLQAATWAQAPAEEPELEFSARTSVDLVLVPAVVRARGGYLDSLDRSDFELQVDGQPMPIELFDDDRAGPIRLAWLQDLSGSMANGEKLTVSGRALTWFLDRARPGDEFALATFTGGRTYVDVPFTPSTEPIREGLSQLEAWGTTALHDAVAWLPEIVTANDSRRRAAILVTDGLDNASALSPAEARGVVQRAELPVYVLGLTDGRPDRHEPGLFRSVDMLGLLARTTGGRYYPITDEADIDEACREIAEELRHQYVLGFSAGGSDEVAFHEIEVLVKGRDRRVFHRLGYQGKPPVAAHP